MTTFHTQRYTRKRVKEIFNQLKVDFNLKIQKISLKKHGPTIFDSSNSIAFFDASTNTINVGKQSCLEDELLVVFHEIGHYFEDSLPNAVPNYQWNGTSYLQHELFVTIKGIEIAQTKYNIVFSDKAVTDFLERIIAIEYDTSKVKDKTTLDEPLDSNESWIFEAARITKKDGYSVRTLKNIELHY